jgi:hypothetical protein
MLVMIRSATAAAAKAVPSAARLVLVPAPPRSTASATSDAVRRFRFARLRLEGRQVPREQRFAHLRASYD